MNLKRESKWISKRVLKNDFVPWHTYNGMLSFSISLSLVLLPKKVNKQQPLIFIIIHVFAILRERLEENIFL